MINTTKNTLEELLSKEVLETNGLGGYTSMSIAGANTRKYHGILIAPSNPPTERRVLVAKVEERIIAENEIKDLTVNQFPDVVHPRGDQFLKSFERRPVATWTFGEKSWALEKQLFMVQGSNTTVLIYKNTGKSNINIELHPLYADKDFHSNFHENNFDYYYENQKSGLKIHSYPDSPPLFFNWSKGNFTEKRSWYKNFYLYREDYRGTGHNEDYYRIGYLTATLKPNETVSLIFTTDEKMTTKKPAALLRKAKQYYESKNLEGIKDKFYQDLLAAGDQFVVNRASTESKTIIAGYHWFNDWGRDTMIAMRGLTIATGKQKESKSILSTFLKYLDQGMLPNNFPDYDGQKVEYNTIDATLWLFVAMYEYFQKFEDKKFIKASIHKLEDIIKKHIEGMRYNIKMTEEGFIYGGQDGWQLTWMDARVDGYVVTPRIGCPVEITALWFNALNIYNHFCKKINHSAKIETAPILKNILKHFRKRYLNEEGYLNDVVQPQEGEDKDFRCNQIYVVSLPFSLLSLEEGKKIVKLVGEKLVTDLGVRSLSSDSPKFRPTYGGNQWERDTAYHEGTVWSFVIGEYAEAYLKVHKYSAKAKKEIKKLLAPLKNHFYEDDCIHGVSEIFDGLEPKAGRGCVNQAWSVAALIQLYTKYELYKIK